MLKTKKILMSVSECWILSVTLLLPLKFGGISVMPETTFSYPDSFTALLVINWPVASFGIVTATVLLLALTAYPSATTRVNSPIWRFGVLWSIGVVIAALPGWRNASTWDYPYMQTAHFASIGSYVLAVALYCMNDVKGARRILLMLAVGTLLLSCCGIEQYFFGFKRTRQYFLEQEAHGVLFGEAVRARVFDNRVFATFTSCNSLAGYLLLVLPLMLTELWRWCALVNPVNVTRAIFLTLGGGCSLSVLLLTKSRAAYLSLILAGMILLLYWPMRWRWRLMLVISAIMILICGAWYIHSYGRGFDSMAARADYLRSSLLLWRHHPIAGCGWGEFFFEHMRLKRIASSEAAHDPHNILMTGAQAGFLLVLVLAVGLLYPVMKLLRSMWRTHAVKTDIVAGAVGMVSMIIHSMMDINVQIPATMAAFGAVGVSLLAIDAKGESSVANPVRRRYMMPAVIIFGLLAVYSAFVGSHLLYSELIFDRLRTVCSVTSSHVNDDAIPEMQSLLQKSVRLRPRSVLPWSTAADFMLARGRWSEAEKLLDEALHCEPKQASLYYRKALAAMNQGDTVSMWHAMSNARKLFPNNPRYSQPPHLIDNDKMRRKSE